MHHLATVSAIALAAAAPALAQQTTETTRTTTTDPATATQSTTTTQTTTTEAPTRSRSRTTTGTATTQPSTTTTTPAPTAAGDAAATSAPAASAPAATPPAATTAPATAATTTAAPATGTQAPATAAPAAGAPAAAAAPNPTVGGAAMLSTNNVVQNASAAPNLSTLVGLVTAADLAATLSGPGPFTVFAPTNDAFGRVAQVTRDALAKPEAKPQLQRVLKYHVVPGTLTLADLKAKAAAGGTLTTVEGQAITVKAVAANGGEAIELTDANGNKSYVETPDVRQSNGIVHVVNGVMFPKLS